MARFGQLINNNMLRMMGSMWKIIGVANSDHALFQFELYSITLPAIGIRA